ncbi:hypothetical protein DIPPA_07494 [Diplonema papillatum]|nr:hypothetical protein DIPPA_07494 [Diplonema papillatum]
MSHWSTPAKGTDPPNAPPNTRQSAALSPRGYSSSPAALQRRRQSKGLAAHPEFWRSSGHHLGIPQSPRKSPSAPRQQPSGGAGSPRGGPAAPQENWASAASPHDMLSPRASPRLNVSLATHSPGPTPSSPSNGHPSAAGLGAGGAGVPQIFVSTATGSSPAPSCTRSPIRRCRRRRRREPEGRPCEEMGSCTITRLFLSLPLSL